MTCLATASPDERDGLNRSMWFSEESLWKAEEEDEEEGSENMDPEVMEWVGLCARRRASRASLA